MVEFSLPANSKVTTGITYKAKEPRESPKNLVIYRWNPEEKKNPRLDTYETVSYTHLTLPTNREV